MAVCLSQIAHNDWCDWSLVTGEAAEHAQSAWQITFSPWSVQRKTGYLAVKLSSGSAFLFHAPSALRVCLSLALLVSAIPDLHRSEFRAKHPHKFVDSCFGWLLRWRWKQSPSHEREFFVLSSCPWLATNTRSSINQYTVMHVPAGHPWPFLRNGNKNQQQQLPSKNTFLYTLYNWLIYINPSLIVYRSIFYFDYSLNLLKTTLIFLITTYIVIR